MYLEQRTCFLSRIVEGCLDVRRELGKELEVRSEARNKHCRIQFCRGELTISVTVSSSAP